MEDKESNTLSALHQRYITSLIQNNIDTNIMSDEEMRFFVEITKAGNILTADQDIKLENVIKIVKNLISKTQSLNSLFTSSHTTELFNEKTPEWLSLLDTLKSLNVQSLSLIGVLIVGHTLLFMLRVAKRIIFKYKIQPFLDQEQNSTNVSTLQKPLVDLFSYTKNVLNNIPSIEQTANKRIADIRKKVKGFHEYSINPQALNEYVKELLEEIDQNTTQNTTNTTMSPIVQVPTSLVSNVGIDETMMLIEKQYNISDMFDKSSSGYIDAVRFVERIKNNIVKSYHIVFDNTNTSDLLQNNASWDKLREKLQTIDVQKLSYPGLMETGNILLFFLRKTRNILLEYKWNDLDGSRQNMNEKYTQLLEKLFANTVDALANMSNVNTLVNARVSQMRNNANAFDIALHQAVAQDIPRNLANFKNLAINLLQLFENFETTLKSGNADKDKTAKIQAAQSKGYVYLQKITPKIPEAIRFINEYSKTQYDISTVVQYETLKKFLKVMQNLTGLEEEIRKHVQTDRTKLVNVLSKLKELLYPSSELYFMCLELYEFLSGTIRIIVRRRYEGEPQDVSTEPKEPKETKETQENNGSNGSKETQENKKINALLQKKYANYDIELNHINNEVSFKGVDDVYKTYFKHTSLVSNDTINNTFGPFYDLFPNNKNDDDFKVANDIVTDGLKLDTLLTMVTDHSTNLVLYSYGYSGSGKTFNFFGKIQKKDASTYEAGLVWKLFRELESRGGVKVKLLKRIKLYGVLEPYMHSNGKIGDNKFVFKDDVLELPYTGVNDESGWVTTINKDLELIAENKTGFVKPTSNNPESSRGFYILKFEVSKGHNTSYIGIVDMAGNEDPYDIANAMIPTLDMSKFQPFLEGEVLASIYDVVHQEVQNVVCNITLIIILFIIQLKKIRFLSDEHVNLIEKKDVTLKKGKNTVSKSNLIYEQLSMLGNVHKSFMKIASTLNSKNFQKSKKSEGVSWIELLSSLGTIQNQRLNLTSLEDPLVATLDPELCVARLSANKFELSFVVNEDLIKKILRKKIEKLSDPSVHPNITNLQTKYANHSIADIAAKTKTDSSQDLKDFLLMNKLKLALAEFEKDGQQWTDAIMMVQADLSKLMLPSKVDPDMLLRFKSGKVDGGTGIKENHESEIKNIIEQISRYFCDRVYFLPVSEHKHYYHYSELSQIVKEGYYINKANAELIHFFQRKRNYEEPIVKSKDATLSMHQQTNSKEIRQQHDKAHDCAQQPFSIKQKEKISNVYDYKGNFDFEHYNKFSVKFPQDSKHDIQQYDTSLVQTLYNEFGDDNVKHIMFACVRDYKETDKIVGAISTLYLVQDLKST